MRPKENAKDAAARKRERRIVDIERGDATMKASANLASDLRSIYGLRNLGYTAPGTVTPAGGSRGPVGVRPGTRG